MRKFLIPLALAASAMVAASPASAQRYGGGFGPARELRQDINQLENRVERAAQRGTISRREAVSLRRDVNRLEVLFSRSSRNGLDRGEIRRLRGQINSIQARLREERRDGDRRRN